MKIRLITYSVCILIAIVLEAIAQGLVNLPLFDFKHYNVISWIAQIAYIALTIGIAEQWAENWD